MHTQAVINRAVVDEEYAEHLRGLCSAAATAGVGTNRWEDLMREFAESPEELSRLTSREQGQVPSQVAGTTNTLLTITTVTTIGCTTTTTTTTTTTADVEVLEA